VIGDEKPTGELLAPKTKLVASDLRVGVLRDTGHGVREERPKETADALEKFLCQLRQRRALGRERGRDP